MYISIVNRQVTCASITNCRSCYYKTTHTEAHTKDTFFLLTSQFARVQSKKYRITGGGYIFGIIQNIKVESNYPGVFYREGFRLQGFPSLLLRLLVLC